MRKLLLSAFACSLAAGLSARELTAHLGWASFNTPDHKPYVETYLSVIGHSITYVKQPNGKFRGAVDIIFSFTQNDSIKGVKKYTLSSPEIDDTTKAANFIDLQRFPLPAGDYKLNLVISDANKKEGKTISSTQGLRIDFPKDSVCVSNITLLESFAKTTAENALSKSGYDLVPYVSSFLPGNMNALRFYAEVYNTQKIMSPEDKFLVLYYLESSDGVRMSQFSRFLKQSPQRVNVLLTEFPVETLPTGSYNLVVEVRNAGNRLLAQRKLAFERLNPGVRHNFEDLAAVSVDNTFASRISNKDSLTEYIRSLRPISSEAEKNYAENRIKGGDIKVMQQYLYNFWLGRNEQNPEGAFNVYNVEVQKVNREFGTQTLKGYQTDRGRVYLQYGPPSQRTVSASEPSAYPYEIWQYYTIRPAANQPGNTTQTNKKFVFCNPDLVTNNYQLIHSDARGEFRDDRWQLKIVKRNNQSRDFDDTKGTDDFGNRSDEMFKDPH